MKIRQIIRESAFRLARQDLALFLQDHEERLLAIFSDEMRQLDDEIEEENLYIDIKMVPLGEAILRAALNAIRRFLVEEYDQNTDTKQNPGKSAMTIPVSLVEEHINRES